MDSILTSIKKMLGIDEEYTHFDQDIVVAINTTMMGLTQIGVGPTDGYWVVDKNQKWTDYLNNATNIEGVKSYIYLKVKLLFDPPSSSFVLTAIEKQITEIEWRLNIIVDQSIAEEVVIDE